MKRCNWKLILTGAILVTACTQNSKKQDAEVGNDFREGQILVTTTQLEELLKQNSGLVVEEVYPEINQYLVKGKSLAGKEAELSEEWQKKGLVQYANPNHIYSVAELERTTDPYWLDLWGMKNIGQDAPNGTEGVEGADIGVWEAWKTTKGDREILVGVVDTGIDYQHPDLKSPDGNPDNGNIFINKPEFNGQEGVDDDGNGYTDDIYGWNFVSSMQIGLKYGQLGTPDPMDGHGHGTHCSGTIGALANSIGVVGVNQKVKLLAIKVLSDEGSGDESDIVRGIRYAAKMKVDVVNASFGGGGKSQQFIGALEEAGKAGVLFVAAAGNDASDADVEDHFPSSYDVPSLISVAATDNRDQLAVFSNYGYLKVDIAAPGVNIRSTIPTKVAAKEGTPDQPYRVFSGTSMATPHVVGAAALILAARKDLRKNPAALKKLLMESSDWKPQLAGRVKSGGRLNVANAIAGKVLNFVDEKNWVEQPYKWESADKPTEHVDQIKTISSEGAKAIQVHIAYSMLDNIDFAGVYDSALRLVSFIPSDIYSNPARNFDYWTPIVYGDSVTLRFANSLVTVTKVKEKLEGISEQEAGELTGQILCFPSQKVEGKMDCTVWDKPSDPFGNNRSEGFRVDKIRVLK